MKLQGKTALITGGGSGIGRGIAVRMAAEGARVAVVGRREERLQETLSAIRAASGEGIALTGDVADEADVARFVTAAAQALGGIDILVNNAGILGRTRTPLAEVAVADWDRVFATNVRGLFLVSRAVIPLLVERGGGSVINISSIASQGAYPGNAAYAASKAAVNLITRSAAMDYASAGVRVNAILPGQVDSEINRGLILQRAGVEALDEAAMAAKLQEMGLRIPLGRIGQPEDIGNLAVFLASDDAAWITGSLFVADGGAAA